jgi:hypothetical protein
LTGIPRNHREIDCLTFCTLITDDDARQLKCFQEESTVTYYQYLYDAVGQDYDWTSRKKLSDAELAALLNDTRLELHVLMAVRPLAALQGPPVPAVCEKRRLT